MYVLCASLLDACEILRPALVELVALLRLWPPAPSLLLLLALLALHQLLLRLHQLLLRLLLLAPPALLLPLVVLVVVLLLVLRSDPRHWPAPYEQERVSAGLVEQCDAAGWSSRVRDQRRA